MAAPTNGVPDKLEIGGNNDVIPHNCALNARRDRTVAHGNMNILL